MTVLRGIFDGKTLKLLEPVHLDRPYWVEVTIKEEVKLDDVERAKRRERILCYAGVWLDLPAEVWAQLQATLKRRTDFFPERAVSW